MNTPFYRQGLRIFLMALLVLLCGCAASQKAVTFSPQSIAEKHTSGQNRNLENMTYAELTNKGEEYFNQKNLSLSKLHFLKALTQDPGGVLPYVRLGDIFLLEENFGKANAAFAGALEIAPDNISALLGSSRCDRQAQKYDEAVKKLEHARSLSPDNVEVLTELAICYDLLGNTTDHEGHYRRVMELLPKESSAFNNLGFHYLLQGNYPNAIEVLQVARSLNPEDRLIKNNLAAAYILHGEDTRGLALFESSLGQAEAFNNVGYIQMTQNEFQKAEISFLRAMELNPKYYVKAAKNLEYLRSLVSSKTVKNKTFKKE